MGLKPTSEGDGRHVNVGALLLQVVTDQRYRTITTTNKKSHTVVNAWIVDSQARLEPELNLSTITGRTSKYLNLCLDF